MSVWTKIASAAILILLVCVVIPRQMAFVVLFLMQWTSLVTDADPSVSPYTDLSLTHDSHLVLAS